MTATVELASLTLAGGSPYAVRVGRRWYMVPDECPAATAVRIEHLHRNQVAGTNVPHGEKVAAEIVTHVLGVRAALRIFAAGPVRYRPLLRDTLNAIVAVYKATTVPGGEPSWLSP